MRRTFKFTIFAASLTAPFIASAHAGHSGFPADHILHYLATPVHAMPIFMAVAVGIAAAIILRKELAVKAIRSRKSKK